MGKKQISLNVNGEVYKLNVYPYRTLLRVLREDLDLTGTKEGCGKGECGACTVLIDGEAVPSCLILAIRAEGKKIITIEGLKDKGRLNQVQEAFVRHGAIQCGFCTPGIVLTTISFLEENPYPSEEEVREALKGHICRCTGYAKYIEAIMSIV